MSQAAAQSAYKSAVKRCNGMTDRERLIDFIIDAVEGCARNWAELIADHLLEMGVIVPPCKMGDTVYVIPSEATVPLNIINGHPELNRVYRQKVSEIGIYPTRKYLLRTCDGLQSVHCDSYGDTWYLSEAEAVKALEKRVQSWDRSRKEEITP